MRWVAPLVLIALVSASCGDPGGVPVPQAQAASTTPDKPARSIPKGRIKSIAFEEFFTLHQSGNILLIDARPAFFYNLGHIPGAVNVPRGTSGEAIRKRDGQFSKAVSEGKTIVTYCTGTTCPDARKLAAQISALGHPVTIFSPGWHAWTDAELPTE